MRGLDTFEQAIVCRSLRERKWIMEANLCINFAIRSFFLLYILNHSKRIFRNRCRCRLGYKQQLIANFNRADRAFEENTVGTLQWCSDRLDISRESIRRGDERLGIEFKYLRLFTRTRFTLNGKTLEQRE